MLNRIFQRLLILLIVAALALSAGALGEQMTVYTATDGAKVYDARGEVLGTLPAGTKLTLTGVKGKVCRVERDGRTAYMRKGDLAQLIAPTESQDVPAPAATSAPAKTVKAYVSRDGAKVYDADGNTVGTLKLNAEVTVTAARRGACRVISDGKTGYMKKSDLSREKSAVQPTSTPAPASSGSTKLKAAKGTAKEMDWWTSDIQTIFARGVTAQITDVETGLTWREQRNGGTNHADCQPLTAADTAAMKQAYGGTWSWNRRAVFVTIDGVNYAASINGMPHGSGSINDNNFGGHHCIHFTNSRTHGSNKVCPLHQAAVRKAASTTLK